MTATSTQPLSDFVPFFGTGRVSGSTPDLGLRRVELHADGCSVCGPAHELRLRWSGQGDRPVEQAYCAAGEALWQAYLFPPFVSQVPDARRLRSRYAQRKLAGLCVDCRIEQADAPHVYCAVCLPAKNERSRVAWVARRAERRARGICHQCGRVKIAKGTGRRLTRCALCRKKALGRYHRVTASGVCGVCRTALADPGRKTCAGCRRKEADRRYASYKPKRHRNVRRVEAPARIAA